MGGGTSPPLPAASISPLVPSGMKIQLLACTIFTGFLASTAADPAAEVKSALEKLSSAKNFTWTYASSWGDREARTTTGKRGSGGHSLLSLPGRDDSTVDMVVRSGKAALKTDDGWKLADPEAEGDENRRLRWMGRMATRYENPLTRINEIVAGLGELKAEDGAFAGTLTEKAAKEMMSFRRGRRGQGGEEREPPAIQGASGKVSFTVKDGVLAGYQLTLSGKVAFNDQERDISRKYKVEFTKVGSTSFDIAEEAAGILAAAPPTNSDS